MYLGWAHVSWLYNNLLYILMFAMVLNINHLPLTFEYIHIFCTICAVFANFSPYILNFNYIDEYAGVLTVNFAFCGLSSSSAFNTREWKYAFTVNFCILIFTFTACEVLRIFVLIVDVLMTFISSRNSFHPPAYKIWERGYVSLIFVIYLVITV